MGLSVARAVQGLAVVALFGGALTSPYLERGAGEGLDDDLASVVPTTLSPFPADYSPIVPVPASTSTLLTPTTTAPSPTSSTVEGPTSSSHPGDTVPVSDPTASTGGGDSTSTSGTSGDWKSQLSPEYVVYDVGCATDLSADGLADFFAQPLGPIKGFDGPRVYPLGDGRYLWMLQDTFIDYRGDQSSFAHMDYANTSVLIQDGTCFTAIQRGTPTHAESFEQGDGFIDFDRYFWPGGGMVVGDTLRMYWMEMKRDKETPRTQYDGPDFYPARTWLATYDLASLRRLEFQPASNDGVLPVYGYHLASEGEWTYLFGNSYLQNLGREGGYAAGPHSATKMFLARVPYGRLDDPLQYWNGGDGADDDGWSTDPAASVPISSRYFTENSMLPIPLDGRWISGTKQDGFLGSALIVDVAEHPWGPWVTDDVHLAIPRNGDNTNMVTYHAYVMPYLDPSGDYIFSLSQIPLQLGADDAPPKYRPNFFRIAV